MEGRLAERREERRARGGVKPAEEEEKMLAGLNFAAFAHFLLRVWVKISVVGAKVAYAGV